MANAKQAKERARKGAAREIKSAPLGLRVTPAIKEALEKAAAADERTVASYAAKVLAEDLREKGYLRQERDR